MTGNNPLIDQSRGSGLDLKHNCSCVLAFVQDAFASNPNLTTKGAFGLDLILQTVRDALEHRQEENVADDCASYMPTRETARIALARFVSQTANLKVDECVEDLEDRLIDVRDIGTGCYTLSKTWTLKGLRYELARQRFLDSIEHTSE